MKAKMRAMTRPEGDNILLLSRTRKLTVEGQCLFHMIMNIICINILGYFSTGKISGAKKHFPVLRIKLPALK